MSFLYPYVLTALILPLLLGVVALVAHHRTRASWQQLVAPSHRADLVRQRPLRRTVLPVALGLLALTFTILAAARPINGYSELGAVSSGRNLIIALDVSRSMETTDVSPSRLEEARTAAYELINALPTDKIGLIVFSGEADLVVPLTYDHNALKETLYNVSRNWIGTGGTNFGLVLKRAMQDFERSAPEGTNALVILSDGEDTMDTSAEIAREARSKNLLVITVGIGTAAGGAIPDAKGQNGLWQDADGKHVISKLNIARLREFAQATGGDFFTMNSGTDLAAFAREAAAKLDRHEENFSAGKAPNDLFEWFVIPALLLLIAAILLHTEWRRPTRFIPLLTIALLSYGSELAAAPAPEHTLAYALGQTLQQEGQYDKAREAFSTALLDEEPALQAAAHHALGNLATNVTFDRLRTLYNAPTEAPSATDEEEAASPGSTAPTPGQPTPEALQQIVDELRKNLIPYQDALKAKPDFQPAQKNIDKINEFIKKLEEEIERLKQQQQQQDQ
ncbi:MAG: VWA domain-containing protein, partial [Akkermansia sp.]|nr:VWA domain-containing protein [Akkermansia sp.]